MDIFNNKALANKVTVDNKFYDKVARFMRGERHCFTKEEITALKDVIKDKSKEAITELNSCVPKNKK